MKKGLLIPAMLMAAYGIYAQIFPGHEADAARLADELVGFQDEDAGYEEIYENLLQILAHPVNLNAASAEELRQLHVLSEAQIRQLISYRGENGLLTTIYELQAIPGFDSETIYRLLPLVKVEDPLAAAGMSLLKRAVKNPGSYLMVRWEKALERKTGFHDADPAKKFQGSDQKMYMRFRSSKPGDFSFGFTAEKDAGERLIWRPSSHRFGADFLSYHAQVKNKGRLTNLIIGDFQAQFGQGLILGGPFGLGKGGETITTVRRTNIGFLPYTSVNESGFFRGAAITYALTKKLSVSGLYSGIRRDATTGDLPDDPVISSFRFTGLHRNAAEIEGRRAVRETGYGAVLEYHHAKTDAGIILNAIDFEGDIRRDPRVYNQFAFSGDHHLNAGGFLNYTLNNFTFFSEAAASAKGGSGMVAGLIGSLSSRFDVSLVYRRFDRDYHTFYANAFSENSLSQNEHGCYWGWQYRWNRKLMLSGYADLFRFPWLAFRRYAPSSGHEWLVKLTWQPGRKMTAFVQAREESKARNAADDGNLYQVEQGVKRNYSVSINNIVNDHWKFRTRVQYSSFDFQETRSEGLVLAQDMSYSRGKFQLTARHALFTTGDFDNRHYMYENDVWMAFSLPAYNGTGVRNYLVAEYKATRKLSLWCRYSRTRYTDRDETGAGVDAVPGNVRNDVKLQALFRF